MDFKEWDKLSRAEKDKAWDRLSETDKQQVLERRKGKSQHSGRHGKRSSSSSGRHSGRYSGFHSLNEVLGNPVSTALKVGGSVIILGSLLTLFISPESLGEQGMLSPSFLILMLAGLCSFAFAGVYKRASAILRVCGSIDAKMDRIIEAARKLEKEDAER